MNRRQFLAGAGVIGAAMWPRRARAQHKRPRVALLILAPTPEPFLTHFREGLAALGYVEGTNVELELRATSDARLLERYAAELVREHVDVIAAVRGNAAEVAKRATKDIPIVLAQVPDAVAMGLVSSLAKPGGNITGVSINSVDAAVKTLELTREIMPGLRRVASLVDATAHAVTRLYVDGIERAGKAMALEIQTIRVKGTTDVNAASPGLSKLRPDAVIIQPPLGLAGADMVLKLRLAPVSGNTTLAAGCLVTHSADVAEIYRTAAGYVDRILKGAKPADLPVQQPTKYETVINRKIARTLGLNVPQTAMLRADRVIE
jgi:putative ABC transport system substrate-binding protein